MLYIQKNFTTISKTVCNYAFCLFLSELIEVKIDHVSVQGNYNRNSICVRPTVSILQSWAFKKHIVKCKRKFRNQNFSSLKRKRKFRNQKFLSSKRKRKFRNQNFLGLKRKRKFRNQNLKSLKRNCKFRNEKSKRFKAQTQILQPKIENSTAQLRFDCLRSAQKFRYLKKFLSTNFCIIEVSKARCRRWC